MSHIYLSAFLKRVFLIWLCVRPHHCKIRPVTSVPPQLLSACAPLMRSIPHPCAYSEGPCKQPVAAAEALPTNWLPSSALVKSDGFDQLSASRGRLCSSPHSTLHWSETAYAHCPSVLSLGTDLSVTWPGSGWRDIFHSRVRLASVDRLKCLLVCFSATLWFTGTASKTLVFWHKLLQAVNSDVWWIRSHRALLQWSTRGLLLIRWHRIPVLLCAQRNPHHRLQWQSSRRRLFPVAFEGDGRALLHVVCNTGWASQMSDLL